jgi:hypothetical protein
VVTTTPHLQHQTLQVEILRSALSISAK